MRRSLNHVMTQADSLKTRQCQVDKIDVDFVFKNLRSTQLIHRYWVLHFNLKTSGPTSYVAYQAYSPYSN